MFAFGEPNLQILERKLFFDFKNPYKIVAFAEPERSEGEATIAQNSKIVKWRRRWDSNPQAHFLDGRWFSKPFPYQFGALLHNKFILFQKAE